MAESRDPEIAAPGKAEGQAHRTPVSDLSRRHFLGRTTLTGLAALAAALVTRRASAQTSKDAVDYQDTPKDGQKCEDCVHWLGDRSCRVVKGDIDPQGWCTLFTEKRS